MKKNILYPLWRTVCLKYLCYFWNVEPFENLNKVQTQICLWIFAYSALGHQGSFEMVARPLEFLSSVKLRPHPLEVQWEHWDSLVAQRLKCLPAMWETWVWSLGREDPLENKWQPTPVFLPGESHGQRSLVGCSPWGLKESDTTEQIHFTFLSFTLGESQTS